MDIRQRSLPSRILTNALPLLRGVRMRNSSADLYLARSADGTNAKTGLKSVDIGIRFRPSGSWLTGETLDSHEYAPGTTVTIDQRSCCNIHPIFGHGHQPIGLRKAKGRGTTLFCDVCGGAIRTPIGQLQERLLPGMPPSRWR